jgi:hypothetical protein
MTDLPDPGREELPPTDEVVVENEEELDILDIEDDPAYSPDDEELRRMKGG